MKERSCEGGEVRNKRIEKGSSAGRRWLKRCNFYKFNVQRKQVVVEQPKASKDDSVAPRTIDATKLREEIGITCNLSGWLLVKDWRERERERERGSDKD